MTSIRLTDSQDGADMGPPITERSSISLTVAAFIAGALVSGVLAYGRLDARMASVETDTKVNADRFARHELAENDRLVRIENKLDRLLEQRRVVFPAVGEAVTR